MAADQTDLARSPTERLCEIARRAFPESRELAALAPSKSIRDVWKQICDAASVDAWTLARAFAADLDLKVASDFGTIETFAVQLVPEQLATKHLILPLREKAGVLSVACACPIVGGGLRRVRFVSDRRLEVLVAPPEAIEPAITQAYSRVAQQQSGRIGTLVWSGKGQPVSPSEIEKSAVVQLGRALLLQAIESRASDLHVQPFAGGGMIRARVDGILRRLTFIGGPVLQSLVRYFKGQAGMDPTNDRVPQDGRMSLVVGSRDIELRLSVLPASRGERLVIRFLDQSRVYRLSAAGFSIAGLQGLRRLAAHSAGVVLLTGPTGSGKTSTLYSMLAEINRVGVSIITIENPVEYRLADISQVEVNPKAGLTFASALRSILRQDPDILLVGEIRDSETADIAMQAALTGHLVLSTLHTNDALTAIPRLFDLGVHPSIVADALVGVVAQRLLRRLCEACRIRLADPLAGDEELFREVTGEAPGYRPVGCSACNGSGYVGRLPVTEIIEMTPELAAIVTKGHTDLGTLREAASGPLLSMATTAAQRIVSGDTTAREATRVMGQRFWSDLSRHFGRPLRAGAVAAISHEEIEDSGVSILLFGRNERDRKAFEMALSDGRVQVHTADDPEAARRILQKENDVVLLIVDLDAGPDAESVEMLKQLRTALAWTLLPVLLIVPEEDGHLHAVLDEHGVGDYLVKPVTPEALLSRARTMLTR